MNILQHLRNHIWQLGPLSRISRIILFFALCLLSAVWLNLYYVVEHEQQLAASDVQTETTNLARIFEEHTLRTLKSADQLLYFIKLSYEQKNDDATRPNHINLDQHLASPFLLLRVIDANGQTIATTQPTLLPYNSKDFQDFSVHRQIDNNELFIGHPRLDPIINHWVIPLTRRLNHVDGSFAGIVAVYLDPYYFSDLYKKVDLGEASSIVLLGWDGIVRAQQSGANTSIGQDLSHSVLMSRLQASDSGSYTATSPIDGIARVYSYTSLPGFPLSLAVGIAEAEMLDAVQERTSRAYMIATLATAGILAFIFPLLAITAKQRRTEQALQAAHTYLEFQVEERTQELSCANEELIAMNEELESFNQDLEEEIVNRKQAEEQLRIKTAELWRAAYFDPLTDLPNRTYLLHWLTEEMQKTRHGESAGALFFIDLDDLKMINDTFGHTHGDAIIIRSASRIGQEAGEHSFIARIGGDEFVVVLPSLTNRMEVIHIAERLLHTLSQKHDLVGISVHVTASIGIALYPADGDTSEEIFKNADNALYAAKSDGKNNWRLYTARMQNEVYQKTVLLNSLRYAVERGELLLHYQPQFRLDQTLIGFEALLRWNSPDHGMVSPARFITLAEQSGLIEPIGRWVLQEACQFARYLGQAGFGHLHIAVNVSARQLSNSEFVPMVRRVLTQSGLAAAQLELEITESALITSLDESIHKLQELQALGVKLALDDFGTGYSSLSYLQQLPVHSLKLDKSFIDKIPLDATTTNLTGAIITMAHILDKTVIAEGVETAEQLHCLKTHACDYLQGYIFSQPLPVNAACRLLEIDPPA